MLSVLIRALLDFAGIAALIPVLFSVMNPEEDRDTMLILCVIVLAFVLVKNGLVILLARVQSNYQLDIYRSFSKQMFANYYHRGLLFLKAKSSVQLGYEVNYTCYSFSLGVLAPLFRIIGDSVLVFLMVASLVVWEPVAGVLLCLAFLPLAILYVRIVRKRLRRFGTEEMEARRKQSRTVQEAFRGYVELEIADAFQSSLCNFEQGMDLIVRSRLRTEIYNLFPSFLSELAVVIGLALLILSGQGNLGMVSGVFAIAAFRLIPAIRSILNSWGMLQNSSHTVNIVADGMISRPHPTTETESNFLFKHSIEVQGISFAFPDGHTLFSDLNMSINRGERIGIRGPSGSGKSTLFNLLLGFLEPTTGNIKVDGRQLTPANRNNWHKLIGYVPQDIFIMEGTLADNIALGQQEIDRNKVYQVLEQVQLRQWANELPQGLDTPLGEYGSRLSGGQKQRIGIARALYKEAEVLFFDEATSALDNHTEQEINLALQTLSQERRELTMIVIAHRESSLAFCDRIFDLKINPLEELIDRK